VEAKPIIPIQQPPSDLPPDIGTCKIPYQSDLGKKNKLCSDEAPDHDSDDVSIAEVLARLGK
jgi:hypothetical protein